jgi:hypothetical protein
MGTLEKLLLCFPLPLAYPWADFGSRGTVDSTYVPILSLFYRFSLMCTEDFALRTLESFYSFFPLPPHTRGGFWMDRHAADRNRLGGLKFS